MDKALETAQARLSNTVAEIGALNEQISALEAKRSALCKDLDRLNSFIATWYEMAGVQQPGIVEHVDNGPAPSGKRQRPKNPDRRDVASAAVGYIRERGEPMSRREIFERLAADGITIQGKDPEMVLSTMLWREKGIIRRLPGGGYWPRDDHHALDDIQIDPDL
ncbi:hypothetical protein ACFQ1E_20050 [Sphingomonas canadensis]|uniref:HTH HARE-type domain-containing protein n=1 Tax=Sphingomonas canadensis TaxID=1219257 RepID=A0ABW3HB15_9SPHN|nr:hypothetical protein [Sphingomonas canadensis]MCW3838454.1 hypothetical protein [Sphingomonas canadensis]